MDFALARLDSGQFDFEIEEGDIKSEAGMNTSVLMSLFSNLEVSGEGGYWGDFLSEITDDRLGSRIWQLARRGNTTNNRRELTGAIEEALGWMIEDSVVGRVSASIGQLTTSSVELIINIYNFADERLTAFNFLWDVHRGRV